MKITRIYNQVVKEQELEIILNKDEAAEFVKILAHEFISPEAPNLKMFVRALINFISL